jgi:hypothetical protein
VSVFSGLAVFGGRHVTGRASNRLSHGTQWTPGTPIPPRHRRLELESFAGPSHASMCFSCVVLSKNDVQPNSSIRDEQTLEVLVMLAIVRGVLFGKAPNCIRQSQIMLSRPEDINLKSIL